MEWWNSVKNFSSSKCLVRKKNHFYVTISSVLGSFGRTLLLIWKYFDGSWCSISCFPKSNFQVVSGIFRKMGLKASTTLLNFSHIWCFFKISQHFRLMMKNHPKYGKIRRKAFVQIALHPFRHGTSKTRNPGFGYPITNKTRSTIFF